MANTQRVLRVNVIKVNKISGQLFEVDVSHDGQTKHQVTLSTDDYIKLSKAKISDEELIVASFKFLLDRESNESILKEFNLNIIQKYFPEYLRVIDSYF